MGGKATPQPLTPALILAAYAQGYFPMAETRETDEIVWLSPDKRAILPLHPFHAPRSLKKWARTNPYLVTINRDFARVIGSCAARADGSHQSWINGSIEQVFLALHHMGYAHSIECWDRSGAFAGGLYGLAIHGAFFGESMVSLQSGASKLALLHLAHRLEARGFSLLDCQFVNPHLLQFGCTEIDRTDYLGRLSTALSSTGISLIDSSESLSNMSSTNSSNITSSSAVISIISSLDCF